MASRAAPSGICSTASRRPLMKWSMLATANLLIALTPSWTSLTKLASNSGWKYTQLKSLTIFTPLKRRWMPSITDQHLASTLIQAICIISLWIRFCFWKRLAIGFITFTSSRPFVAWMVGIASWDRTSILVIVVAAGILFRLGMVASISSRWFVP